MVTKDKEILIFFKYHLNIALTFSNITAIGT